MDSSYYWEVRVDWKVTHPKLCMQYKIFSLPAFTVFCMLNYYNNQLLFLGKNFCIFLFPFPSFVLVLGMQSGPCICIHQVVK